MKKLLAVSVAVISVSLTLAIGCGTEGDKATAAQPVAEVKAETAEQAAQSETANQGKKSEPAKDVTESEAATDQPEPEKYAKAIAAGLKTEEQRISYCIGHQIGSSFRRDEIGDKIDMDMFLRGIKNALAADDGPLTMPEKREIMMAFFTNLKKERIERLRRLAEKNKKAGEAFLAENAKKEGIVVRESGIQYKVLVEGDGPKPGARDIVTVNYRGTLIDGTEFDSSYTRGKPAEFGINQVVPGWSEALSLMPVGSKWQLFIPGELAYGERGNRNIEPNSTLIFEIELLGTRKGPEPRQRPRPPRPGLTPKPLGGHGKPGAEKPHAGGLGKPAAQPKPVETKSEGSAGKTDGGN
ncbi:MAG: hypothetical protein GWP05_04265 [Anaerolineaceae bacterium]|nr:hypothetical protein [Anaerolineaceae bacterium]